ncbi:AzlD domain-containing protein [Shewanella sp. SR43-4]|jgi:branched-subunit amino acid transport protein|uniref:AzlD domain-containing protein n=1 Tax=Shewanella vesiculosa TaxID=518738 RepID=A0ABV0FL15_9GAMM|nr:MULTISPECIES: AzlD domain-containing protein [Shewanella]MBB1319153.1 AzlD domain-containing protein [Shewanella sp. SR43-4]MBB1323020.1 AzlD domain-containing protein [Shewanella sp. SR43-8]MBB1391673.1 AzlD domain-containing protein [Shewanella sp. SG44-6]RPA46409.1 AzlD domain-containing protein [Shewanella vesiculosa]UJL41452.1 AzlD domain-containing protein [Shewanella vesiculosa]|tara:strand:+ start:375 stop:677 length:303 start_codon:yes stop_codon:yes gene_type:complete
MIWLIILSMAAVVFISRHLLLEPKLPIRLSKNTLTFLSYSAPAVLTAILAPIVFVPEGQLAISVYNPYLTCALVATVLAYVTRNTLLTTVLSMGLFFILY